MLRCHYLWFGLINTYFQLAPGHLFPIHQQHYTPLCVSFWDVFFALFVSRFLHRHNVFVPVSWTRCKRFLPVCVTVSRFVTCYGRHTLCTMDRFRSGYSGAPTSSQQFRLKTPLHDTDTHGHRLVKGVFLARAPQCDWQGCCGRLTTTHRARSGLPERSKLWWGAGSEARTRAVLFYPFMLSVLLSRS